MKKSQQKFLFTKTNYALMALGVVVILMGFYIMSGGTNEDPTIFSADIFSQRRIFWAPLIVIIGFVIEVVAIFYRAHKKESKENK
ncbi:MAG: DUF3098 domain-containing protein [Flavobacteriales bacterium]|nr:DUF3098 domain-containing protein [Flavobacteriales bacterium]